eukprot:4589576-Ditylum_brightwellii.AAC.3
MARGNIKPPMWDDRRQTCCLYHLKGSCDSDYTRKYSHSNGMSDEVKKDHGRFIKEYREFERKSGKD